MRKLDRDLLQLITSFIGICRTTIMLTCDKNFILIMLQLRGKIAVLQDGLTEMPFDIKNACLYIETSSTSTINLTLISPPHLQ